MENNPQNQRETTDLSKSPDSPKSQGSDLSNVRQRHLKDAESKIEKEYKRKLFVVRNREKVIASLKKGAKIFFSLLILAGLITSIVRVVIYFWPQSQDQEQQQTVADEGEKPPEDFGVKMTEIKLLQPVVGETSYDVMARIVNEDPDWGISKLDYTFTLKDSYDKVVAQKKRTSYILPDQSKHLIEVGIETERLAKKVELKIEMNKIQKLKDFTLPKIVVADKNYQTKETKVTGELRNDSPYDFEKVEVGIILFDELGNVVGLNFTNINAFTSNSKRSFIANWEEGAPHTVGQVYVEPNINVFGSGVFMNNYGSGQSLDY